MRCVIDVRAFRRRTAQPVLRAKDRAHIRRSDQCIYAALKIGQPVRGYAMQSHLSKSGTPTMGGVLILLSIAISTLLWFDLSNRFVWIVLIVTLGFAEAACLCTTVGDQARALHDRSRGRHQHLVEHALRAIHVGADLARKYGVAAVPVAVQVAQDGLVTARIAG